VYDLMPLLASLNGDIYEKIEGLCATAAGKVRVCMCLFVCLCTGPVRMMTDATFLTTTLCH
jgi:hypothetical protein